MARFFSKQIKITAVIAGFLLLILISIGLLKGRDETTQRASSEPPGTADRGFAFLDLHADSVLTEKVRSRLAETLGSEAVERRTVLDLEVQFPGFLEKYFPDLNELNRRLNFEGGRRVRIEHNTVKLVYRYSTPFDYVELFFSGFTRKPLLFRIRAKGEGSDYLAAIQQKYGQPKVIRWEDGKGRSLLWHLHRDALIFSIFSDQYGDPRFEIMICHVENIEALLATEKKEAERRKTEEERSGRPIF